jgi:hypothetical protein
LTAAFLFRETARQYSPWHIGRNLNSAEGRYTGRHFVERDRVAAAAPTTR